MAERALQVALLLCLLSAFVVDAERRDNEEELEGPRDAKAIVGNRGGGMRVYRERPPRHGEQGGPRRTGEIEIKIGKIREGSNSTNGTDMNKPGQGRRRPDTGGPPGRGRPPRPGSEGLDDVEFNVTRRKYVPATLSSTVRNAINKITYLVDLTVYHNYYSSD